MMWRYYFFNYIFTYRIESNTPKQDEDSNHLDWERKYPTVIKTKLLHMKLFTTKSIKQYKICLFLFYWPVLYIVNCNYGSSHLIPRDMKDCTWFVLLFMKKTRVSLATVTYTLMSEMFCSIYSLKQNVVTLRGI